MTFSNEIRQELCNIKISSEKEMCLFLNSVLLFSGKILLLDGKAENFYISINNKEVAKKIIISNRIFLHQYFSVTYKPIATTLWFRLAIVVFSGLELFY